MICKFIFAYEFLMAQCIALKVGFRGLPFGVILFAF